MASQGDGRRPAKEAKELYPMSNWKYDVFLWTMSIIVDLFFRAVSSRGSWYVPRNGPVLFIAAPHANQFVDALILMRTLRREAQRRVSLLIAQKSVHGFVGWGSRQVGSVPVGRAQDAARPAHGTIYLPDPIDEPTLIRGIGTRFDEQAEVGGMIFLPSVKGHSGSSVNIAQIVGPNEIRTKRPFKGKIALFQLTGRSDTDEEGKSINKEMDGPKDGYQGTSFKLAPQIDQKKVYDAVCTRLIAGGCVGIFPEGGSHDRTELLPLKAGVAIMALETLKQDPDCGLSIVPVGMNYFHPHKFRSRAVIEFGPPFQVPHKLIEMYDDPEQMNNERREAIGALLDTCTDALKAVTVSAPDFDTLTSIQAARRLYMTGRKLPLSHVVELNRRLSKGFSKYKDDPVITGVLNNVREYNKQLQYLNIRDHQVENVTRSVTKIVFLLIYRLLKLATLSVGVIPGLVLFGPVFVVSKAISIRKAKTALAGSTVKIAGRDVMATWKLMVAMFFAPILYNFYIVVVAYTRAWGYAPTWCPWWMIFFAGWIIFPAITFAALRFGEVGMDIAKSIRPLVLCLSPTSSYSIQRLRQQRADLAVQVGKVINSFGPEMYEDFEKIRLVQGDYDQYGPEYELGRRDSEASSPVETRFRLRRGTTESSRAIPRNESFSDIGKISMFATRPPSRSESRSESRSQSRTRAHSRSSSSGSFAGFKSRGFPITAFTTLDSQEGFAEANDKISKAFAERSQTRRRKSGVSDHEETEESSDDGQIEMKKTA